MLKIPFVENPGKQCGQACMAMALKYYFPDKEFTIGQINLMIRRQEGKWTFPQQNAVALDELGLSVKAYSSIDIPVGRDNIIKSFRQSFGRDYDEVIRNIDLETHEYFSKIAKEKKLFEVRRHSIEDIAEYIKRGCVVIACVDSHVLYGRKGSFVGHAVIVTGMSRYSVWINDPDRGSDMKYPKDLFEKAYKVPETDDDILVVFGKK
jgi:hypothetical protein